MKVSATRRKGYAHSLTAGHHTLISDEPESQGGADAGPSPPQLLAMSLAACTAITIELYAERKGWDVGDLAVDVDYEPGQGDMGSRYDVLIKLPEGLTEEQAERIGQIAAKCPVHRALCDGAVEINDRVQRAGG